MGCTSSAPAAPAGPPNKEKAHLSHPTAAPEAANPATTTPAFSIPSEPKSKLPSIATPVNRALDRIDAIDETRAVQCDGVKMRYAYLSQRGKYPDDPLKANQDAYCVQESLRDGVEDAFFAVFDGHGNAGDGCAIYAKKFLPKQVKMHMEKAAAKRSSVTKEKVQSALLKSHVDTNKGLHRNASIDDSLSGTTAISMYLHGRRNRITISNVGDSRAVLGRLEQTTTSNGGSSTNPATSTTSSSLKALALSRDQTPYRKDERARIRGTGARILSLDQLEGLEPIDDQHDVSERYGDDCDFVLGEELDEGGDPPRVWHPTGDYPGTAFTRSIGDAMAEDLGVFAEPEMLTREIMPQDKIIVLASDGVFEFLTNQSVIDLCAKFADPLEACRAVVAEAYELWLQYELRTDDITIICIFIDEVVDSTASDPYDRRGSLDEGRGMVRDQTMSSRALVDDTVENHILSTEGLRPVRKNVSKEKSKEIQKLRSMHGTTHHSSVHQDEDFDWKKHTSPKTEEEKSGIAEAIQASIMFRNINAEQREMVFACMESVRVKAGSWVIRQGTVGDRFYIIDDGRFEVRIVPDGEEDTTGEGGHIVHVYEGSRARHAHPAFGELALMYSAPRSASIVAQTDGHLWALHRAAFRQVLMQAQDHRKELKKVLAEIPYFQYLDSDGINKLAAIMDEITFGRGETICEQGKPGESVFVIQSGTCSCALVTPKGSDGSTNTRRTQFKAGNYFGDEIFSGNGNYQQTVVSLQTTSCWQLDANLLKQTMGPLLQGSSK
jgi:serine/threonine protein phosphatase PrpC/CRP-like cAMP-binding protein